MTEGTSVGLIVNADDFGQSPGVNQGVIRAHEHGIVTSASLMVRWPAAAAAAAYGRTHRSLGLGLHVDLGEWVYRDGTWVPVYEVVDCDNTGAVEAEVLRQLREFKLLVGEPPTHIDSHQHIHRKEPARSILRRVALDLDVTLRHQSRNVRYCGDFHGADGTGASLPENIRVEALLGILAGLPPGITELACHPGAGADLETTYLSQRAAETEVLCDPIIAAAIARAGIIRRSFRGLAGVLY